jgi:hypothetical protein
VCAIDGGCSRAMIGIAAARMRWLSAAFCSNLLQTVHLVQAATAKNADQCGWHG